MRRHIKHRRDGDHINQRCLRPRGGSREEDKRVIAEQLKDED